MRRSDTVGRSGVEKANKCKSILLNPGALASFPQPVSRVLMIMCTLPSWDLRGHPSEESHWPQSNGLPLLVYVSVLNLPGSVKK